MAHDQRDPGEAIRERRFFADLMQAIIDRLPNDETTVGEAIPEEERVKIFEHVRVAHDLSREAALAAMDHQSAHEEAEGERHEGDSGRHPTDEEVKEYLAKAAALLVLDTAAWEIGKELRDGPI